MIENEQIGEDDYHCCGIEIELASVEINRRRSETEFSDEVSEWGEKCFLVLRDQSVNTMARVMKDL
jgi:hypothetical protein